MSPSVNGPPLYVDGQPLDAKAWRLTLTNDLAPWDRYPSFPITMDQLGLPIEAHLTLDADAYERIAGKPTPVYTIEQTFDLNPWHRATFSWQQRLRQWRDGLSWSFRRRVLRRDVPEAAKITIPNCEIRSAA